MDHSRFREEFEAEMAKMGPAPDWVLAWGRGDPGPWDEGTPTHANGLPAGSRTTLAEGEIIEEGKRDRTFTRLAGRMRECGFSEEAMFAALDIENRRRCDPPMEDSQVRKIARSIGKKDPNPFADVEIVLPGANGAAAQNGHSPAEELRRLLASELRSVPQTDKWLLTGLIPAGLVTIFSAIPKAGKTTFLSHLLRAVETDGAFCGQAVRAARVCCITEETETLWSDRRDKLGLRDHCSFVLRPFRLKPKMADWLKFIQLLERSLEGRPADLLIFDTLANLWPVENENDASEVTAALLPLKELVYRLQLTLLLVHHLRKSEGLEGNQTRGSNGLTAAVDSILEFRRFNPKDRKDRRRILNCNCRSDDSLDEVVVELASDGLSYMVQGDRKDASTSDLANFFLHKLPREEPGWTLVEAKVQLDRESKPYSDHAIKTALEHGMELGLWNQGGDGKRGAPYRYWRPV